LVMHALLIALLMAAVFTAGPLLAGPTLYRALGGSDGALAAALAYSNVVFVGALAVWLVNALASVLRGSGQMVIPAAIVVSGELLHLGLAPALIFGLGPFPQLGVSGAGLSLVASFILRAAALAFYVLTRQSVLTPTFGASRLRGSLFWEIL